MVKEIPKWAAHLLTLEGARRIEDAVASSERRTSGEIVPMLVHRSSAIGLVPVVTSLALVLIMLAIKYAYTLAGMGPPLWVWAVLFLAAVFFGQWMGRWEALQRWILPRYERKAAVQQRALLEFHEAGLNKTEGETGILLFVSLLEHEAVVLFDKGIARHCKPEVFQDVVAALIEGAKAGNIAAGYERAIALCTDVLVQHFPPRATNPNELKDYLRIEE